ncbi:MAG: hypothetical protein OK455_06390 [Thaumarchaeota archaeon]|nr:hypothetical protein [Nitrososphaerota archaeon]
MQHVADKTTRCDICGKEETSPGTFPKVIGVGRVCLSCGMEKVKCDICGEEVKRLTSSRFQGKNLCLKDHMKEVEKYKQHIVKVYDEDHEALREIFRKSLDESPEGYTLLTVRRARNSMHVWEAEYEKSEILQMRCS